MATINAVYENGVFRPTEPVKLPEGTVVQVQAPDEQVKEPPGIPTLDDVYAILSTRFDTGEKDLAERHNEHQP